MNRVIVFLFASVLVMGGLSAQDRFLRKAHSAFIEKDYKTANELVGAYESKEGSTVQSRFMKYKILYESGVHTAQMDEAWEHLKYAANLESLSEKDKKKWCEEVGLCEERLTEYRELLDRRLFETYRDANRVDFMTSYLSRYQSSKWFEEAGKHRCRLAYIEAKEKNSEDGYLLFLKDFALPPYTDSAKFDLWEFAFRQASSIGTKAAYERYNKSYPKSPRVKDAKQRMADSDWNEIKSRTNRSDFVNFIWAYPEATQLNEAKKTLEGIDWKEASSLGTIDSYDSFLRVYPESVHKKDANERLQSLRQRNTFEDAIEGAIYQLYKFQLTDAESTLYGMDIEAPKDIMDNRDSLLARIKFLRPLLKQIPGKYIVNSSGVELILLFGVKDDYGDSTLYCKLKGFSKGVPIRGIETEGTYDFDKASGQLVANWDRDEFNNTMSRLTVMNQQGKTALKLQNGTVYRKLSNDYNSDIESTVKVTAKSKSTISSKTTYITVCGSRYENGTNFSSMLPSGWENRVGFYCLKNYHESLSTVYVSGAVNNGILIKATGEVTGSTYTILYTCSGELF